MIKIDKNKRLCALLITTSLVFPLVGCNDYIYENDMYIYNGKSIIDKKSGVNLLLTEEKVEEIINSDDKIINLKFGDNELSFETTTLKKELIEEQKRTKGSRFIGSVIAALLLGCLAVHEHKSTKLFKDTYAYSNDNKQKFILVKSSQHPKKEKEKLILVKSIRKNTL